VKKASIFLHLPIDLRGQITEIFWIVFKIYLQLRRMPPRPHPIAPHRYRQTIIQLQRNNRRSTTNRYPRNFRSISTPNKMLSPSLLSWIEQPDRLLSLGNDYQPEVAQAVVMTLKYYPRNGARKPR
jgi:hypothetical protein